MFGRVEQLSYKRSSGQAAISWLRGEHSAPHDSWRLAKWLSCQLLASYLSKQVCDQLSYMVKHSIRAATLSATLWPSAHRRQISSGAARSVARDVVLCTVTRVQTKEKTATRARKHRGGQPAVITCYFRSSAIGDVYGAPGRNTETNLTKQRHVLCQQADRDIMCLLLGLVPKQTANGRRKRGTTTRQERLVSDLCRSCRRRDTLQRCRVRCALQPTLHAVP